MDSNKEWETSGADIFTQGFELVGDAIEIIDYSNDKYMINIRTGKIENTKTMSGKITIETRRYI